MSLRPVLKRFDDERRNIGRGRTRQGFVDHLERSLICVAQRIGKLRVGRLQIVLRLHQQELRSGQVHVRKTHIQAGPETALGQRADLIRNQLARLHGFFGDSKDGLRLQNAEVRQVDAQQHVGARRGYSLLLRLRVKV